MFIASVARMGVRVLTGAVQAGDLQKGKVGGQVGRIMRTILGRRVKWVSDDQQESSVLGETVMWAMSYWLLVLASRYGIVNSSLMILFKHW